MNKKSLYVINVAVLLLVSNLVGARPAQQQLKKYLIGVIASGDIDAKSRAINTLAKIGAVGYQQTRRMAKK